MAVLYRITVFVLCVLSAAPAQDKPALQGLDPVELVRGRQVAGDTTFGAAFENFTYLFSNPGNRAVFLQQPEPYAIQMGGSCARMGPTSGLGDPDRFLVHDAKIYIFASESCRNTFGKNPDRFIVKPDEPLVTPADQPQAIKVLERAADAMGGPAALGRLSSIQFTNRSTYEQDGQTREYFEHDVAVFPEKYAFYQTWHSGEGRIVVNGAGGYRLESGKRLQLSKSDRDHMIKSFYHRPVMILKARQRPDFRAVMDGYGTIEQQPVTWIKTHVAASTTRLAVSDADGRILACEYRGRFKGMNAQVRKTFSDFRKTGELELPYTSTLSGTDEPGDPKVTTLHRITVNDLPDMPLFEQE